MSLEIGTQETPKEAIGTLNNDGDSIATEVKESGDLVGTPPNEDSPSTPSPALAESETQSSNPTTEEEDSLPQLETVTTQEEPSQKEQQEPTPSSIESPSSSIESTTPTPTTTDSSLLTDSFFPSRLEKELSASTSIPLPPPSLDRKEEGSLVASDSSSSLPSSSSPISPSTSTTPQPNLVDSAPQSSVSPPLSSEAVVSPPSLQPHSSSSTISPSSSSSSPSPSPSPAPSSSNTSSSITRRALSTARLTSTTTEGDLQDEDLLGFLSIRLQGGAEAKKKLMELEKKYQALEQEKAYLKKQLGELEVSKTRSDSKMKKAKERMVIAENAAAKVPELERQLQETRERNETARQKQAEARQKLEETQQLLASSEKKTADIVSGFESEVAKLKRTNQDLERDLKEQKNRLEAKEKEVNDLALRASEGESKSAGLEQQVQELQNKMEVILLNVVHMNNQKSVVKGKK